METYSEYLAHHGILGMKWGKRNGPPYPLTDADRSSAENRLNPTSDSAKKLAKQSYKEAKRNYRRVRNGSIKYDIKNPIASRTVEESRRYEEQSNKVSKAEKNVRDARINLYKEKKGGSDDALLKAYAKELSRYGLPNSAKDMWSGYKSRELLNDITVKHGEAYANDVLRKTKKKLYTELAAAGAVTLGMYALEIYAMNR